MSDCGSAQAARLAARELLFTYPSGAQALRGVTLEFGAGEFLLVIGPNGSGKSTLLRVLCGLLPQDGGTIHYAGVPLVNGSARERARRMAFVPQALAAIPDVRVEDFVLSGRYAHQARWGAASSQDWNAVRESLRACDASEFAARPLTQLSGGQRQRVLIARALAQAAPVMLIDEPTSALDPEHQVAVFDLLERLRAEGRALCVVTHDLNLASQYATRVVLLDDGRVVADGAPEQVLRRAVLEPVYGSKLHYGRRVDLRGVERPFVLPERST